MRSLSRDTAEPEGLLFEAVITPHRSLSRRGIRILAAALAVALLGPGLLFWALGAWPVLGFSGVELGLAAVLIQLHARSFRRSEIVLLTENGVCIQRRDASGRRTERHLDPAWLRLELEDRPGRVPALMLRARGVAEEIAASLGETEKRDLAAALGEALHRWRNPVFDNPQLRV